MKNVIRLNSIVNVTENHFDTKPVRIGLNSLISVTQHSAKYHQRTTPIECTKVSLREAMATSFNVLESIDDIEKLINEKP